MSDEKYIRYLWRKNLSVTKENIYLLKQLVKQGKIKLDE
jgi:hypothetical protein|tara:strand:+ start:1748 stop:1864 length:117 start_codon:yes stop_codon:yes gene_type:complete